MNRDDSQPFEDQRLGVPGTVTESEADQHLRGMVKNQLDTHVTLERYILSRLVYKVQNAIHLLWRSMFDRPLMLRLNWPGVDTIHP